MDEAGLEGERGKAAVLPSVFLGNARLSWDSSATAKARLIEANRAHDVGRIPWATGTGPHSAHTRLYRTQPQAQQPLKTSCGAQRLNQTISEQCNADVHNAFEHSGLLASESWAEGWQSWVFLTHKPSAEACFSSFWTARS